MGMCGQKKTTSVYRKVGLSDVLGVVCMPYWRTDTNEQTQCSVGLDPRGTWPDAQKLNGSQRDSHRQAASLRRVEFLIRCVASGNSVCRTEYCHIREAQYFLDHCPSVFRAHVTLRKKFTHSFTVLPLKKMARFIRLSQV